MTIDLFPSSEFDDWAEIYDTSVAVNRFPFYGYSDVLKKTFELADVLPGHSILDLGTGTGNLALLFARAGCVLWCTDFSRPMLDRARLKLPAAHFLHHDLRTGLPPALDRKFDRIVSAYVFHHFALEEKIRIIESLASHHMSPDGRIVIADIAFQNGTAMDRLRSSLADGWEDEFYWLADESLPVFQNISLQADFVQVSPCAGVFTIRALTG